MTFASLITALALFFVDVYDAAYSCVVDGECDVIFVSPDECDTDSDCQAKFGGDGSPYPNSEEE